MWARVAWEKEAMTAAARSLRPRMRGSCGSLSVDSFSALSSAQRQAHSNSTSGTYFFVCLSVSPSIFLSQNLFHNKNQSFIFYLLNQYQYQRFKIFPSAI